VVPGTFKSPDGWVVPGTFKSPEGWVVPGTWKGGSRNLEGGSRKLSITQRDNVTVTAGTPVCTASTAGTSAAAMRQPTDETWPAAQAEAVCGACIRGLPKGAKPHETSDAHETLVHTAWATAAAAARTWGTLLPALPPKGEAGGAWRASATQWLEAIPHSVLAPHSDRYRRKALDWLAKAAAEITKGESRNSISGDAEAGR